MLNMQKINLKGGKVFYNNYDIDPNLPFKPFVCAASNNLFAKHYNLDDFEAFTIVSKREIKNIKKYVYAIKGGFMYASYMLLWVLMVMHAASSSFAAQQEPSLAAQTSLARNKKNADNHALLREQLKEALSIHDQLKCQMSNGLHADAGQAQNQLKQIARNKKRMVSMWIAVTGKDGKPAKRALTPQDMQEADDTLASIRMCRDEIIELAQQHAANALMGHQEPQDWGEFVEEEEGESVVDQHRMLVKNKATLKVKSCLTQQQRLPCAPISNERLRKDFHALKQQEKDDLFLNAVVQGNITRAELLLDCRACIDVTNPNIHLLLPEDVLPKFASQIVALMDLQEHEVRSLDEDGNRAAMIKWIGGKISETVSAADVAVAHGHDDMVRFLLNHPARKISQKSTSEQNDDVKKNTTQKKAISLGVEIAITQGRDFELIKTLLGHSDASNPESDSANQYLLLAQGTSNRAVVEYLLEDQNRYAIDIHTSFSGKQMTLKSLFHAAVSKGDDSGLELLLKHECKVVQFSDLDDQIRSLIATSRNECAAVDSVLQPRGVPQVLVSLIVSYKDKGVESRVEELLQNSSRQTSLTLTDAAGQTPLVLAHSLTTPIESKEDENDEKSKSVSIEKQRQRCVRLLEQQSFALAQALVKRQLDLQEGKQG